MHSLLRRQLSRFDLSDTHPPDPGAWTQFLATIEATYCGHDQDRYLLERAMTLSSTEMRTLHSTLRHDRERLSAVIDSLNKGLIVLDRGLQIELANPEAARILGTSSEDLRSWTIDDLRTATEPGTELHAILVELADVAGGDRPVRRVCDDAWIRGRNGQTVPVSASVLPVHHEGRTHGAIVILRDVSDHLRLEVELRQAQKLEAVGRLAAGVAHEINTPMQFVVDNVRFLEQSVPGLIRVLELAQQLSTCVPLADTPCAALPEAVRACDPEFVIEEMPEALSHCREGVDRVTSIVRAMKSFSHPGSNTPSPADLNQALRDTVTVARGEFKTVADIEFDLGEIPTVECLVHDLKQVFLNLVVNASHTIADRMLTVPGRGRIRLASTRQDEWVIISIGDDGAGIPDDVAEHIFEPFFTTKEVGKGSGQGLALAHSVVVDGHGGKLTFTTEQGVGTTFELHLPIRRTGFPGTAEDSTEVALPGWSPRR